MICYHYAGDSGVFQASAAWPEQVSTLFGVPHCVVFRYASYDSMSYTTLVAYNAKCLQPQNELRRLHVHGSCLLISG